MWMNSKTNRAKLTLQLLFAILGMCLITVTAISSNPRTFIFRVKQFTPIGLLDLKRGALWTFERAVTIYQSTDPRRLESSCIVILKTSCPEPHQILK